jgi:hypothetical protein
MAWKTVDVDEQTVRFVVSASDKKKSFLALCQEFDISRPTGYQWLHRYQTAGVGAIVEKSRRPRHSPARTPRGMEQRVRLPIIAFEGDHLPGASDASEIRGSLDRGPTLDGRWTRGATHSASVKNATRAKECRNH